MKDRKNIKLWLRYNGLPEPQIINEETNALDGSIIYFRANEELEIVFNKSGYIVRQKLFGKEFYSQKNIHDLKRLINKFMLTKVN